MEICIKWTMCRTCTSDSSSELQPLFKDAKLANQLKEYTGLVVESDDGLPDQICVDCMHNLQLAHTFISGCKRADEHLRNVVHRTMSSGKCFQSIVVNENDKPSKLVTDPRARKQVISERKYSNSIQHIKHLNTYVENSQIATAPQMSKLDIYGTEKRKGESVLANFEENNDVLEFLSLGRSPGKSIGLDKSREASTNNNDDYLLVVSKCILNHNEAEVTDSDGNEYVITDEVENDGEDDNYIKDTNRKGLDNPIMHFNTKKLKNESHAIDLGAACEPSNFPKYSCSLCGNSFPNQTQLRSHLRTHRNEKNYECELCSKRFNAACNLTTHMRTHTGEKPFECSHCGRRFADRSTHRKHERMHTNERPYACNVCAKTFSLSTTLKAHFLSHSQEKPHKCHTCNKGFRLPHQLKAHERTHVHRYEMGIMLFNQDEGEYSSSS